MPLFQHTVITKYLKTQDKNLLQEKWIKFQNHFLNPTIQENIRNSKEEQYQGEFLLDLFVTILGYTKNPQPDFNLTTEYKNIKDSKKADGAIIMHDKVVAVIELKGTDTTDLSKIEIQAFGYKNNQPDCTYIITSNFEKIRLYIDNAIEHIEFNLFKLTKSEFDTLYLLLSCTNLAKNIAKTIKEESLSQEDQITKRLYKDYSLFKRALFHDLVVNNPSFAPIELFKKSQKLLDRFLFLFFAEDRHLLPPNSVRLVLSDWKDLQERDVDIPLYDRFKKYFEYLNIGYKGKRYDVYAYNGGLFKPDEILDHITIDDNLLYQHALKLSDYDFASEVDVNILGHIFENSLNELDEIKAELEGEAIDKSKTKRKKDGVFYTPKYITKYIVENTVGKLCNEKKSELQLVEEDYTIDKKRQKKTVQHLNEKLQDYRKWLLQLTICDPACGSGAFLNQALDFLIQEHAYIDELQAKLFGDAMVLSDVEKSILENNLFGVDLNEESVEIAKLSLWLRTAQPNRKLNDLSGNIKCGNSLIDDNEVAGDKAFHWQEAFPQVFAKGGFDVIIGNPPYGASLNENEKKFIRENFKSMEGEFDTYIYFLENLFKYGKKGSNYGWIIPNNILNQKFGRKIREIILRETNIDKIVDFGLGIFESAVVPTVILMYSKVENPDYNNLIFCNNNIIDKNFDVNSKFILQKDFLTNENFQFNLNISADEKKIIDKLDLNSQKLKQVCELKIGIEAHPDFINNNKISEFSKPLVRGRNFNKYALYFNDDPKYVEYIKEKLHRPREERLFLAERKLLIRQTGDRIISTIDENKYYAWKSVFVILANEHVLNLKYLLALLNSSTINFYYQKIVGESGRAFAQVKGVNLDQLPIKVLPIISQEKFITNVDLMLSLNKVFYKMSSKILRTIQRKFEGLEINKKLENWYELPFAEFVKELGKKKIKLSLSEEVEWEDYFLQEQQKAIAIKNEIDATDKAIDQMVYELYGLTEEEIKIVENS